ncbi:MAG TPA: VOC family protein [Terriglobales bacterium]|nr:VOC family protein [Terriglobales bacterium]
MGFHHTAFATRDVEATHKFYTDAMGFELAKVVCGPTPEGGWAKHLFYETGNDEYIAFWDLHDVTSNDWSPSISLGQGLPLWVNHLAFRARDVADIGVRLQRWLDHGCEVHEVDHGWCTSIYTVDPNGILVEFCTTTRALTQADRNEAQALLRDPKPPFEAPPRVQVHRPKAA